MEAKTKAYIRQVYMAITVGYIILFTIVMFTLHLMGKEVVTFSNIFFGSVGALTAFVTSIIFTTPKDT